MTDRLTIVRIVGNDLSPRHAKGSAVKQLEFVLANENLPQGVSRKWVLNRVVDKALLSALAALLARVKEPVKIIPFLPEHYREYCARERLRKIHLLQRTSVIMKKAGHIISLNDARNQAMEWGSEQAEWVLPMDGGCCFTRDGISSLLERTETATRDVYAVPMYRILSVAAFEDFTPRDYVMHEPQLVFRRHVPDPFSAKYLYGDYSKISSMWHHFPDGSVERNKYGSIIASSEFHAGYVLRLPSGRKFAEGPVRFRSWLRHLGMMQLVRRVESQYQ